MDQQFHYDITYLVCRKAGYDFNTALKIAHSSQFIDDNNRSFEIKSKEGKTIYRNYISQTKNIFKPNKKLLRIYPVFHFIPGDPLAETAKRKDGKSHILCCTPNSKNAHNILYNAMLTKNPYRIGIAAHGFADTWAHQNFVGIFDSYNSVNYGLWSVISPDIGHADVKHDPDLIHKRWIDTRLVHSKISNKERFIEAASCMFVYFADANGIRNVNRKREELVADLSSAIGRQSTKRLKQLEVTESYGEQRLPPYDKYKWFDDTIHTNVKLFRDVKLPFGLTFAQDIHTPRRFDYTKFRQSNWYKFQEAIKTHQKETLNYLFSTSLKGLTLSNF